MSRSNAWESPPCQAISRSVTSCAAIGRNVTDILRPGSLAGKCPVIVPVAGRRLMTRGPHMTPRPRWFGLALAGLAAALSMNANTTAAPQPTATTTIGATTAACGGQPCDAVVRGFVAFLDRRLTDLGGNGRSCADCHMPTDQF